LNLNFRSGDFTGTMTQLYPRGVARVSVLSSALRAEQYEPASALALDA